MFLLIFFCLKVRLLREQSSSNLVETNFEKSSHKQTKEALDLSEKTVSYQELELIYLPLRKTVLEL
jgi:hypothetical protein